MIAEVLFFLMLVAILACTLCLHSDLKTISSTLFRLVQLENRASELVEKQLDDEQADQIRMLNEYNRDYQNFQSELPGVPGVKK